MTSHPPESGLALVVQGVESGATVGGREEKLVEEERSAGDSQTVSQQDRESVSQMESQFDNDDN